MEKLLLLADDETKAWFLPVAATAGYHAKNIVIISAFKQLDMGDVRHITHVFTTLEHPAKKFPSHINQLKIQLPDTPFILLADGPPPVDTLIEAMKLGANNVLIKGKLTPEELKKAIAGSPPRQLIADYRLLFEETPVPMFIFDTATFEFLDVNHAALSQYGYTRKEFLSLKVMDIRPSSEVHRFLAVNSVPDTYFDAGKWLHQTKCGRQFHVHIFTYRTSFNGRGAKQVMAINVDAIIKTEQALKDKSDELNIVLESITEAFYTLDNDWIFTYINKEFEKLAGQNRDGLLGKCMWDVFPFLKGLNIYKEFKRAVSGQLSVHFEEQDPRSGVWVDINAYPTKNGLAVYMRNITGQKRAQERIYNDGQNLRAIINNTNDRIWSVDRDFRIITGNQAFWRRVENLTGKTEGTLTDDDFKIEAMQAYHVNYERAFKGEAFKVIRHRVYTGNQLRYEEMRFNPIIDQKLQVIGVNVFIRDITEQQHHLDEIEKQNGRLREIAWIQSHQVRPPVASILGLTQLFNLQRDDDPRNGEIITMMGNAARQLDDIIRDITAKTEGLEN